MNSEKLLKGFLLTASGLLCFSGVISLIDVQLSLSSAGVIILTSTEANELTAIYGGVFIVLGALCFVVSKRIHDVEMVNFVGLAFWVVALSRFYAAFRHGFPESPRIYVNFATELFLAAAILILNRKVNKSTS
ncbi:MAG: hypothetical protein IEMM0002_0083 [bacterium]|nr:MAG: hypothetical protein IEMM0002_0083 [bacterium]